MKNNLQMLYEAIETVDADPVKSLAFYNNPQMRLKFLQDVINFSINQIDNINDPMSVIKRHSEIVDFLDRHFQQYAWSAHEVHFHTNFMQHASCPFACLNEISTIIDKVIKEKFTA